MRSNVLSCISEGGGGGATCYDDGSSTWFGQYPGVAQRALLGEREEMRRGWDITRQIGGDGVTMQR